MDKGAVEQSSWTGLLKVTRVAPPAPDLIGERFERDIEGLDRADGRAGNDRRGGVGGLALLGGTSCDGIKRGLTGSPVEVPEWELLFEEGDEVRGEGRGEEDLRSGVGDCDPLRCREAVICHGGGLGRLLSRLHRAHVGSE